ncbi:MAG TPA: hypothetical protein VIH43_07690 [Chthoniobacterales bacterium]
MTFAALTAALATIFAAGYGTLSLVAREPVRLNLAEQFGLSWLFGTGLISLLIWLAGFCAQGAVLQCVVTAVCFLLAVIGRKQTPALGFPKRLSFFEFFLAAILVVEIAIVFYLSFVRTLGWDGLLNWEIKARYAFENNGVLPPTYLADSSRTFSHHEYPLAVPFTQLWLYFWLGQANQFWAKIVFPMFYASGSILLAALAIRLGARLWLGLVAAICLFFIPQISVNDGGAVTGYIDFPISVFYLASIGLLLCAIEKGCNVYFKLYAVCLAFLPWIKRDGVVLWAVAAACGMLVILRTKKSPLLFLTLLPGFLIICAWHFYLSAMRAQQSSDFLPVNLGGFATHLYRVVPLLFAFLAELKTVQSWSLFWLIVGIGVAYLVPRIRDLRVPVLFTALIAPIFVYSFTYIFSDWPNYQQHVALSISRLLMHVVPVGVLIVVLAVCGEKNSEDVLKRRAVTCRKSGSGRTAVVELA